MKKKKKKDRVVGHTRDDEQVEDVDLVEVAVGLERVGEVLRQERANRVRRARQVTNGGSALGERRRI